LILNYIGGKAVSSFPWPLTGRTQAGYSRDCRRLPNHHDVCFAMFFSQLQNITFVLGGIGFCCIPASSKASKTEADFPIYWKMRQLPELTSFWSVCRHNSAQIFRAFLFFNSTGSRGIRKNFAPRRAGQNV